MKRCLSLLTALILLFSLSSCSPYLTSFSSQEGRWCMGFGSKEIALPEHTDQPLYIAGYNNGIEITDVTDLPRANAVWMDTGENGILLIGIDCIGCGSGTVNKIRQELADFCRRTDCASVNIYATHTHAGVDTLGLWGPVAIDGKNADYMENLISAAIDAANAAYADRSQGTVYYGSVATDNLLQDSREPLAFDASIHQIRFVSSEDSRNGIRLLSYAAHAEALRGENTSLSRDFPGALADNLTNACGDDVLYMPGAIGGLIMTRELVWPFDAEENMRETAARLTTAVLSIRDEVELLPRLAFSSVSVKLPLDNTFFFFGKFLGILDNEVSRGKSETGYMLHSEIGALMLGSITFALIPGEIFPELVSGRGLSDEDPEPLQQIAARYDADKLMIIGLCNDELGYIIPPSAYLLNDELPYIESVTDATGENHYEETNSVGIGTAEIIAEAFEEALKNIQQ